MDLEVSQRLESLENSLKEVKDLYLSIKIEFMELKRGMSEGAIPSTGVPVVVEASSSSELASLKSQVDAIQRSLLTLNDQHRLLKNEVKAVPSIPIMKEKGMPKEIKEMMEENQRKLDELAKKASRSEQSPGVSEIVVSQKIDGLKAELAGRIAALESEIGTAKSSYIDRKDLDTAGTRLSSLENDIRSKMVTRADLDVLRGETMKMHEDVDRMGGRLADQDDRISKSFDNVKHDFDAYRASLDKFKTDVQNKLSDFDIRVTRLVDYEKELIEDFGEFQKGRMSPTGGSDRLKSERSELLSTRFKRKLSPVAMQKPLAGIHEELYGSEEFNDKVKRLREVLDRI